MGCIRHDLRRTCALHFACGRNVQGGSGNQRGRPEGIDGDAMLAKLRRHAEGQQAHGVFGGGVSRVRCKPLLLQGDRRRQDEDMRVGRSAQVRQAGLRTQEGASDVDVHHQVIALERRMRRVGHADGARVVDQDVDTTEPGHGLLHRLLNLIFVAHVHGDRQRPAAQRLDLGGGVVDGPRQPGIGLAGLGGNNDVRAVFRGFERDRFANAPAGTGDEDGLALQGVVHWWERG